MHFPTLSIFGLHRPGRSSSAMVFDLDVNHPVPPLPLLKSSRPPPLILFLLLEHPLRGHTDACIVLDIHKMLTDNISFVVHSSDNCYGTDTVPLSTQYFIAAFTFTPFGVQHCFWLVLFLVGFFLPGKFDFNLMLIPVVDRPCLALVRQCRKKKTPKGGP